MVLSISKKIGQIKELVYFANNDFDISCNYLNEILKKQAELVSIPISFYKANPFQYLIQYSYLMKKYKNNGIDFIV